jgi:hypothetical protein
LRWVWTASISSVHGKVSSHVWLLRSHDAVGMRLPSHLLLLLLLLLFSNGNAKLSLNMSKPG